MTIELENIHLKINTKSTAKCISGKYEYYHYKCDGFNDVGWGCGYRTIQTICSWLRGQIITEYPEKENTVAQIPSIQDIQKILVDSGDKPANFIGSREWIGSFEAMIIIDTLYDIPCRMLHCPPGSGLLTNQKTVLEHFESNGGPIMMGGDLDAASKCVLGYAYSNYTSSLEFLIADPHFTSTNEPIDENYLIANKWISWQNLDSFDKESFYNFCLPQKRGYIS